MWNSCITGIVAEKARNDASRYGHGVSPFDVNSLHISNHVSGERQQMEKLLRT